MTLAMNPLALRIAFAAALPLMIVFSLKDGLGAAPELEKLRAQYRRLPIEFPADNPYSDAKAALGKKLFFDTALSGSGTFSCASCHVQAPGEHIRAEVLAPALGILNAMPIYRSEWGGMGTTSRRFTTCNSQVRGVPLKPQDPEYRNVEYYLSYMANGIPITGPGARP